MRVGLVRGIIAAAAVALISLTWGFTYISVDTERNEASAHAEGNAVNLARTLEWQLTRQLQTIDQTMQILAVEWKNDPQHFDPAAWKKRSSLLGDASLQLSILDPQGIVATSTRQEMNGTDLSDRDYFQAQRASRRSGLFIGPATKWRATGRWVINLSRRLEADDGTFLGIITVAYDPWSITSLFEQVDLGTRGFIALLGSDGSIRALVSPYRLSPGEDVSTSEMYRHALSRNEGSWTGPSAPDGLMRVHAFRHLADQDLTIVVGLDRAEALRTSDNFGDSARFFAIGITVMMLLLAGLLMREVSAGRRREQRLAEDRHVVEESNAALEIAKSNAEEKTRHLEATLAGMSDGVMLLDERMRLVEWNDKFAQYCGLPVHILRKGMSFEEILRAQAVAGEFGPVDPDAEVRRRIVALSQNRSVGMIERQRPNGRTIELRRTALPGGGYVTLYSDITARKQTEEAQAGARRLAEDAADQKSRFVAIVSHEIRTPLNAVVNSLALLDRSGLSSGQHRLAHTARQAGDALLDLVNDILELSKTESGQLAMRPTVFDLRPVLEGVQDMFGTEAMAREITLALDVHESVPQLIRADGGRLRQIMMNFVSNATKFSLSGLVTMRAAGVTVSGRASLFLSVTDQGPRIPEREAGQLFQPFSRLENARAKGAPGTGLGLAICERLTRLMGGTIGLHPATTGGNEFWIVVPLEEINPVSEDTIAAQVARPRVRRANVLLVEDIPANHIVTATMLRRHGHRVDVAESGPDAIHIIQQRPYDLVFMDLMMPGMSGYEAARHIRTLPGLAGSVPIVALTATTADDDRARCIAAGMNDMLGKPLRPAELLDVLARILTDRPDQSGMRPETTSGPAYALSQSVRNEAPAIDLERFADLERGLPPATLATLIDQCLQDMIERLPYLDDALQARDRGAIEENAHMLAGMAGTYGLAALERRMRKVMAAAKRGDFASADSEAMHAEDEIERAGQILRGMVHEKAA